MTTEEFNLLVHTRCEKIQRVLATKAAEYARGDRLSNFKRAAAVVSSTPERALLGMMLKHWVSILDLINDLDTIRPIDSAIWDEKIGDSINYLILLEGLVGERIDVSVMRDTIMASALEEQQRREKKRKR